MGRTNSDVQKRDEHRNRQTNEKYSTFFAASAAGEIRALAKLNMVIENFEHILALPKLLGIRYIISPLVGA